MFTLTLRKPRLVLSHHRFRQSPRVLATWQGAELVLLDTRRERYYTLNEVGSHVWEMLASGATYVEIVSDIRRCYDMPAQRLDDPVEHDVSQLLRSLWDAGLILADSAKSSGQQSILGGAVVSSTSGASDDA